LSPRCFDTFSRFYILAVTATGVKTIYRNYFAEVKALLWLYWPILAHVHFKSETQQLTK